MSSPFAIGNFDILAEVGGYITEDDAKRIVKNALDLAKEEGSFDDTKVYNTYEDMVASEPIGREDVLYILETDDEIHGTRYVWDGSSYVAIQDTLTSSDIHNIFND